MRPNLPHNLFRKPGMLLSFALVLVMLISCSVPGLLAGTATPLPPTATLPPLNSPTPQPPTATPQPTPTLSPSATATPAPVNIVFAPGATAAVEQGSLQPAQVQAYTLSAGQYQPMILILDSPNHDVTLGVTGADGTVLLDPAKKWTNWQWLLPKTELYTIRVYGGATAGNYTLTAKVAQRITFPAGTSSIMLGGFTPKGFVFSYAISCKASQVMTVSLNVPATTAYLDIFGLASGTLLSASSKAATWTGTLPTTQDYIIEVIPVGGQVVNYTITVSVN